MRSVLLTAALLLALATPALAAKRQPTLHVVDTSPLSVRGAAFRAREAVVVTVRESGRASARRTVRASVTGRFTVNFAGLGVHPCGGGGTTITAVSASGAVAKAKLPQTLCPPPLTAP